MKKFNLILMTILLGSTIYAQQTPFTDGGFESTWVSKTGVKGAYWDLGTDAFVQTLNTLYSLTGEFGDAPLTAFRDEDAYNGNYSIKLVSNNMFLGNDTIFLPGAVGTLEIDMMAANARLGRGFEGRPINVSGYYKYEPINGDSAAIEVVMYKDSVQIGVGKLILTSTVSAYTPFTLAVTYTDESSVADSVIFLAAASADYDFSNITTLLACQGQPGSALYLDDLSFVYSTGVKETMMPTINIQVMPNPATNMVRLSIEENTQADVLVYDQLGRLVEKMALNGQNLDLNVTGYATGTYIINLEQNNRVIASKRFVKK